MHEKETTGFCKIYGNKYIFSALSHCAESNSYYEPIYEVFLGITFNGTESRLILAICITPFAVLNSLKVVMNIYVPFEGKTVYQACLRCLHLIN